MEKSKLEELINNKLLPNKKQDKDKLVELITYYEDCLEEANKIKDEIKELHRSSIQNHEKTKEFNEFYDEFFIPIKSESTEEDLSKIENFKTLYSNIIEKSEDIEEAYKNLDSTIKMASGEEWKISKFINYYSEKLSKLDTYEKQLDTAKKSIDTYTEEIKQLKIQFTETKKEIQKLLNPASVISLSNSYKETREEDYKKTSLSVVGNYTLFLVPLILILIYFLYPSILKMEVTKSEDYIKNLLPNISVIIPLSIISWFGLNSIKKNKHMHDEYNHKQRLMQTYVGFKVENDKNDENNSLMERLHEVIINSVAENPNKNFKEDKNILEKIVDTTREKIKKDIST